MKLDIQLFSDGLNMVSTGVLSEVEAELKSIAESLESTYDLMAADAAKLDSLDAWVSEEGGVLVAETLNDLKPEIMNLIGSVGDLATQLTNVITTYEGIDNKVKTELEGWATTLRNAVNKLVGGVTSTTAKGSYSAADYAAHMSQSAQVIVNEVATMVQNTGNMYASVTGTNLAGTVKTLFDWVGSSGASRTTSFVNSLFGA